MSTGCCYRHGHGCWQYGPTHHDYPPPFVRYGRRPARYEEEELEEHLQLLEAELDAVRRRIRELHQARRGEQPEGSADG